MAKATFSKSSEWTYAVTPSVVFECDQLSKCEKAMLWALSFHGLFNEKTVWPGVKRLGRMTGWEEESCTKALQSLATAGIIVIEKKLGEANHYHLDKLPVPIERWMSKRSDTTPENPVGVKETTPDTPVGVPGETGVVPPRKTGVEQSSSERDKERSSGSTSFDYQNPGKCPKCHYKFRLGAIDKETGYPTEKECLCGRSAI